MIGLLAIAAAHAADPSCLEAETVAGLAAQLDAVDASLAGFDVEGARSGLSEVHRGLSCLDEIAPAALVSRLALRLSMVFFYDQDTSAIDRWAQLARVSGGSFDDPVLAGHPLASYLEDLDEGRLVTLEDAGFVFPKKGGVFVNGALLPAPAGWVEVPGLLQITDKRGLVVASYWIDGTAFPEDVLGPPGTKPAAPKGWSPPEVPPAKVATASPPAPEPPVPVEAPPEPVSEPAPEPVASAEPDVVELPESPKAGVYVDPFTDARRRALVRSVTEREIVGDGGAVGVVRTEVITFVSDPSGGELVTQAHFAEWLVDYPEWAPGGPLAKSKADDAYLSDWTGAEPADPSAPVTRISLPAARAYCGSWGNDLPPVDLDRSGAVAWEWRKDGDTAAQRAPDGSRRERDPHETSPDVGFRCAP